MAELMTKRPLSLARDWHALRLVPDFFNSLIDHRSRQIFGECGVLFGPGALRIRSAPAANKDSDQFTERVFVTLKSAEEKRWAELKPALSSKVEGEASGLLLWQPDDTCQVWAEVYLNETLFDFARRRLDTGTVPQSIYIHVRGTTTDSPDDLGSIWNVEECPYLTIDDFHLQYHHLTPPEEKDEDQAS